MARVTIRRLLTAATLTVALLTPSSNLAMPVCNERECVPSSLCGNWCSYSGFGSCHCLWRAVLIYCHIPGEPPRTVTGYDCTEDFNCTSPGGDY